MPDRMMIVREDEGGREMTVEHAADGSGEVAVLIWIPGRAETLQAILVTDADRRRLAAFLADHEVGDPS